MMTRAEAPKPVSIRNAERYTWGAGCDGWHLVRSAGLSVIEERMPAKTTETRHFHTRSRQFFYVLEGELTVQAEGEQHVLQPGQGLEVIEHTPHQVSNRSEADVRMLVISQPPSHADRVPAPL